jgi:hypothetical protein
MFEVMFNILIILGLWIGGIAVGSLIGPITALDSIILLIVISSLCYILGKVDRGE